MMFAFVKFAVVLAFTQTIYVVGQNGIQWIPQTTTAAEMWNGYTWYWPYAIAAAEGYRNWFANAQQITNQLYQQAYITGAFTGGQPTPPSG